MSKKPNSADFVKELTSSAAHASPALSRLTRLADGASLQDSSTTHEGAFPPHKEGHVYRPGDRVSLPLTLIADNPRNPRVFFVESDLVELKASIASEGQLTPVQVLPADAQGRFVLRSGHRRVRALKQLGRLFAQTEVVAPALTALDEYRQARAINVQHRSHSLFDDALRFQELLEQQVVRTQAELAEMAGMRPSELSKLLSIAELGAELLEQMASRPAAFGLSIAYLVYGYWKAHDRSLSHAALLVKRIATDELSVREVARLVAQASSRTADAPILRRGRALSRATLEGPGRGELKVFEGKLNLQVEGIEAAARDALFRRMVKLFEDSGFGVRAVSTAEAADAASDDGFHR